MAYDETLKKQRTFVEQIVIISVLAIFMAVLVNYLMSNQAQVKEASFNSLKSQFRSQLSVIRGQWLLSGKPNWLEMPSLDEDGKVDPKKYRIYVNKYGWPDSPPANADVNDVRNIDCEFIWQSVFSAPMTVSDEPVTDILISRNDSETSISKSRKFCRYLLNELVYFDYDPISGQVL